MVGSSPRLPFSNPLATKHTVSHRHGLGIARPCGAAPPVGVTRTASKQAREREREREGGREGGREAGRESEKV